MIERLVRQLPYLQQGIALGASVPGRDVREQRATGPILLAAPSAQCRWAILPRLGCLFQQPPKCCWCKSELISEFFPGDLNLAQDAAEQPSGNHFSEVN